MSELTTIEAKVSHLEGEVKDAFHEALERFKAELVRLGIEHAVTPAAPAITTDPQPISVKTGGSGGEHPDTAASPPKGGK